MIAGRLQEKNGYFYVVLSYKDSTGKRKEPWISTGLTVKGNKRQAQKLLEEYRLNFDTTTGKLQVQTSQKAENTPATVLNKKTLYGDYLLQWVEKMKDLIEPVSYDSYKKRLRQSLRRILMIEKYILKHLRQKIYLPFMMNN